jgi:hypothetical protein
MRLITFIAAITAASVATVTLIIAPAFAQSNQRIKTSSGTEIIVTRQQKSFVDAGTVVKPGTGRYLNYTNTGNGRPDLAFDPASSFRGPLPDRFSIPGF